MKRQNKYSRPLLQKTSTGRSLVETLEGRLLMSGDGLQASYFNAGNLSGPSVTQLDPQVNFNWAQTPPPSGIAPDQMSVRWTGQIVAPATGVYTFTAAAQGGVRMWVNGKRLINAWNSHRMRSSRGRVRLAAGQAAAIRVEFHTGKLAPALTLLWGPGPKAQQMVPTEQLYSGLSPAVPPPPAPPLDPNTITSSHAVSPRLSLSGASTVKENTVYSLGLSGSDPGHKIQSWSINWGDGSAAQTVGGNPSSVTHTYLPGPHSWAISATATDDVSTYLAGNIVPVNVTHVPPVLSLSGAASVNEGSVYTLNLSASDPGHTVKSWSVNWGDGSPVQAIGGSPSSVTHTFSVGPHNWTVSASAADDVGSDPAANTVPVSVTHVPPVLSLSGPASVNEGAVYTLNLSASDPGHAIKSWSVDWGDGSPAAAVAGAAANVAHSYAVGPVTRTIRATAADDVGTYPAANTVGVTVNSVSATSTHAEPARTGGFMYSQPTDLVTPQSGHLGNVFYQGQPVTFTFGGDAQTYEVRDYNGTLVDSGTALPSTTLKVSRPGWYKLYLYGPNTTAAFGDVVGGTTFSIFRNDPNFPVLPDFSADGQYFAPAFSRVDAQVNFNWGNNPPDPGLPGAFGVRWTGQLQAPTSGTYTFSATAQDGVRVWVNGQEIIDGWASHSGGVNSGKIALQAGVRYNIEVDYYHDAYFRTCVLSWSDGLSVAGVVPATALYPTAQSATPGGLTGTYYAPLAQDPTGAGDPVIRNAIAIGPERYQADANDPAGSIARLEAQINYDAQFTHADSQRPRPLMIAFPAGTANLAGVVQIVQHFQDRVQYWEGLNEPNFPFPNGADYVPVEQAFYNAVKGVNANLKVLGPGVVTIGPNASGLAWLNQFFGAGGGRSIDALSFHAYNNTDGDLTLARESMQGLQTLLNQYGLGNIEKWQTEQGFGAAMYGAYEPTNQGRWTMLQQMVFEEYGIPKEQNYYWYDRDHGFPDFPFYWENSDGSLNPAAPLMRVWSEELYGTTFQSAYDFGPAGNDTYVGSLFSGPGKSVAAFMSGGATDGRVPLNVSGSSLHVVDAFGNGSDLPVVNGQLTLAVGQTPVYAELAAGQSLSVVKQDWGQDLALTPGVVLTADGSGLHPVDPAIPNSLSKLNDGILQDWYYTQTPAAHPWMDNSAPGTTPWVEMDFPAAQTLDHVVVRAPSPWQWDGAPLDYLLQYYNGSAWVTLDHVQEDSKTFGVFSPQVHTTVDSFYSERSIFTSAFAPVTTAKIRLLVNNETWGGGATQAVAQAGGQTGPHQLTLSEIQVYGPPVAASSSAAFVKTDTTTQGSWNGIYGSQGYSVFGGTTALPAYAQLTASGQTTLVWSPTTPDVRAPFTAAGSSTRVAASDYSNTSFSFDLNLTDGQSHQVALYMNDWDTYNTRAQTVAVTDAATGALLDVRLVNNFFNGQYLAWNLKGHVKITLTNTGTPNAMAQGLFFDPAVAPAV